MEPEQKQLSKSQTTQQQPKTEQNQVKVHKGLYINNERRKGGAGRIKSASIDLKIEVPQQPQALHESVVEWIEVKRYTRYKNDKRNQGKEGKTNNKKQPNQQQKPSFQQNNQKYEHKYQQRQNPAHYKEVKSDPKQIKKVKYVLKQETGKPITEKNQQTAKRIQSQKSDGKALQVEKNKSSAVKEDLMTANRAQNDSLQPALQAMEVENNSLQGEKREKVDGQQGQESAEESESDQEQEIIVAKIIREVEVKYAQKPFVGLLYFKKNKQQKYSQKQANIFESLTADYAIQVYPINRRLQVLDANSLVTQDNSVEKYCLKEKVPGQAVSDKDKRRKVIDALEKVYATAVFTHWKNGIPYCKILKTIGKVQTVEGQCAAFLYQYGLNDFEHQNKPQEPMKIRPTSLHVPIQNKMIFTIDPKTSVDLDDALSIEEIENGIFQIGIHIADVTSYLQDIGRQELLKRTTSVYLPHKTYHMLPEKLMKVCTLDPNVKRLAFSIYVRMEKATGQIIGQSRVEKNIIKSRFKLAYEQVQDIITGKGNFKQFNIRHPCSEQQYQKLVGKLETLTQIAMTHRNDRILFEVFENKQVKFELDQDNWPAEISVQKRFTAQKVVEEYMIIGNIEAAKHVVKRSPKHALIIHHPPPTELSMAYFNQHFNFKEKGIKFDFKSIREAEKQLLMVKNHQQIPKEVQDICYFKARRTQQAAQYKIYEDALKQMQQAQKDIKNTNAIKVIHFALGLEYYTHFTSPMRRMADIIVHEALNCVLLGKELPQIPQSQIQRINFGRTATKRLKRDLIDIYLALMARKYNKEIEVDATIASFGMTSGSIYIPMFDSMTQIMWRTQLQIERVYRRRDKKNNERDHKNKTNNNQDNKNNNVNQKDKNTNTKQSNAGQQFLRLYSHYDKRDSRKDVFWDVKKFSKLKVFIGCTDDAPLRPRYKLLVKTNKGERYILPNKRL